MTRYLTMKVRCPIDKENAGIEDCYDCQYFEGFNDARDLLMCGYEE